MFKDNENLIFESTEYRIFNFATKKILDNFVHRGKIFDGLFQIVKDPIYKSLLPLIEFPKNPEKNAMKVYFNLNKSLFLKIITNPNFIYEADDVMQIVHSKIYLFLFCSRKMTKNIFNLFLYNQFSMMDIYQAYNMHYDRNLKIFEKSNILNDVEEINLNVDQFTEGLQIQKNDQKDSKNDQDESLDSAYLIQDLIDLNRKFTVSLHLVELENQRKKLKNTNRHPFDEYMDFFHDIVYSTHKFLFYDRNNILLLSIHPIIEKKSRNSLVISTDTFFENLKIHKGKLNLEIQNHHNNSNILPVFEYSIQFSFLEYLQQRFCNPYIELGNNLNEIMSFFTLFNTIIHPKSIFLNVSKFYSHLFFSDCEQENSRSIRNFNALIHIILDKTFLLKFKIDAFHIAITKSRIFNITDMNINSMASFTPSLHTSICCLKEKTGGFLETISSIHVNTYLSKKRGILNFFQYKNKILNVIFKFKEIKINDIDIKQFIQKNQIKHINAIIEYNNCTIEIQKSNNICLKRNSNFSNSNFQQIENLPKSSQIFSQFEKTGVNICKFENHANQFTSFQIYLLNFINIKSRNQTSYVFLTGTSGLILDILDCGIDFLFRPAHDVKTINITNSILLNSSPRNEKKYFFSTQINTDINIKQTHLTQNTLAGSYNKIAIQDCNKFLNITAQFRIIEISGVFDEIKIIGQFNFHLKSKKSASFLFEKDKKCLNATNIIFVNNEFSSFIEHHNLSNCEFQ